MLILLCYTVLFLIYGTFLFHLVDIKYPFTYCKLQGRCST